MIASTLWFFFSISWAGIIKINGPNIVNIENNNDPNAITISENRTVIIILKIVFIINRGRNKRYSNLDKIITNKWSWFVNFNMF